MLRVGSALLLVIVVSSVAWAGSETNDAVGRMHYELGLKYYGDKRYQEALKEFTEGYELTKRAPFLLNIAQTHRQLGDLAKAHEFYRTYLLFDGDSKMADGVRAIVADIEQEMSATKVKRPTPPEQPEQPEQPPVQASSYSRSKRAATYALLGLTAVSALTAMGLQLSGFVDASNCIEAKNCDGYAPPPMCADTNTCEGMDGPIVAGIITKYKAAYGMWAVTGALGAATIIVGVLSRPRPIEPPAESSVFPAAEMVARAMPWHSRSAP